MLQSPFNKIKENYYASKLKALVLACFLIFFRVISIRKETIKKK